MKRKYLTKQRIECIIDRQFHNVEEGDDNTSIKQEADGLTFVEDGRWHSSMAFRRKCLVQKILVDYQKSEEEPEAIPVRIQ